MFNALTRITHRRPATKVIKKSFITLKHTIIKDLSLSTLIVCPITADTSLTITLE